MDFHAAEVKITRKGTARSQSHVKKHSKKHRKRQSGVSVTSPPSGKQQSEKDWNDLRNVSRCQKGELKTGTYWLYSGELQIPTSSTILGRIAKKKRE